MNTLSERRTLENHSKRILDAIKAQNYQLANTLYAEALAGGFDLTANACNVLAQRNALIANLDISDRILHDMTARNIPLEEETYTAMIISHSAHGNRARTEALFQDMLAEFQRPSTRVFNALISVNGRDRQLQRSIELFEQMNTLEVQPDIISFNMMLAQYAKAGAIDAVERKFRQLKEVTTADSNSYNIMISAYNHLHRLDDAMNMLNEMRAADIQPGTQAFESLIAAHLKDREYDRVKELIALADELEVPFSASYRNKIPVAPASRITCKICGEYVGSLQAHLTAAHPSPRFKEPGETTALTRPLGLFSRSASSHFMRINSPDANNNDAADERFNVYNAQRVSLDDFGEDQEYQVYAEHGALSKLAFISPDAIAKILRLCAHEKEWTAPRMMKFLASSWIRALQQARVLCVQPAVSLDKRSHSELSMMPKLKDLDLTQSYCLFNTGLKDESGSDIIVVMTASSRNEQPFQLSEHGIWRADSAEFRRLSSLIHRTPSEHISTGGIAEWHQDKLEVLAPTFFPSRNPNLLIDPDAPIDPVTEALYSQHVNHFVEVKVLDAGELDGIDDQAQAKWTRGTDGFQAAFDNFRNWVQASLVRVRKEPQTAVPSIHYKEEADYFQGSLRWLLPLYCGTDGVELALSMVQVPSNNGRLRYAINSVLAIDTAFSDARLITQPDARWMLTSEPEERDNDANYAADNENAQAFGI